MEVRDGLSEVVAKAVSETGLKIDWYRKAAFREKKSFLRRTGLVRALGFLAGTVIVASALRIDQVAVQAFPPPADWDSARLSHVGQLAAAVGVLISFFAYWTGRSLDSSLSSHRARVLPAGAWP